MTIVQKICDGIQRIVEQLCGIEDDNDEDVINKLQMLFGYICYLTYYYDYIVAIWKRKGYIYIP